MCLNRYRISSAIARRAGLTRVEWPALPFPPGHKDPFDRLLIAQAMVEGLPVISVDAAFDHYPVRRIW